MQSSQHRPRLLSICHNINQPYQSNKHYTAGIEYIRSNNNKGKFNFKYSWQRNNRKEYDVRRGSFKEIPALDLTLDTHDLFQAISGKDLIGHLMEEYFLKFKTTIQIQIQA